MAKNNIPRSEMFRREKLFEVNRPPVQRPLVVYDDIINDKRAIINANLRANTSFPEGNDLKPDIGYSLSDSIDIPRDSGTFYANVISFFSDAINTIFGEREVPKFVQIVKVTSQNSDTLFMPDPSEETDDKIKKHLIECHTECFIDETVLGAYNRIPQNCLVEIYYLDNEKKYGVITAISDPTINGVGSLVDVLTGAISFIGGGNAGSDSSVPAELAPPAGSYARTSCLDPDYTSSPSIPAGLQVTTASTAKGKRLDSVYYTLLDFFRNSSLPTSRNFLITSNGCWRDGEMVARTNGVSYASSWHPGSDIGCSEGSQIFAVADGVVTKVVKAEKSKLNYVIIEHVTDVDAKNNHNIPLGTKLYSRYLHVFNIVVSEGQSVSSGQTIATCSNSGTRKVHLHFEFGLSSTTGRDSRESESQKIVPFVSTS